jgi:hypothetical protein
MVAFQSQKPKYVDLDDGRTVLDLYNTFDKTALFIHIMDKPRLKETLDGLIDARDTQGLHQWVQSLESEVLINGDQKAYLLDVFRECVFTKFPQEREKYESLCAQINDSSVDSKSKVGKDLNVDNGMTM